MSDAGAFGCVYVVYITSNIRRVDLLFWIEYVILPVYKLNKEADSLSLANKIEQMFYMSLANKRVRELVSLNEPTK